MDEGRPRPERDDASVIVPPSGEDDAATPDAGLDDASRLPCTISFGRDIVPAIAQAGCASITCHGSRLGSEPRIEPKDPSLTYDAFVAYRLGGKPYLDPRSADPDESTMSCHFRGKCGKKMPPKDGRIPDELAAAVDAWLACGAPKN